MALSENMWKGIDVMTKLLGIGIISGVVTLYGTAVQNRIQTITEANREMQAAVEIVSRQKDLDTNMGMRMFEILMSNYFQKSPSDLTQERIQERMVLLRLIALNFQDVPINLKPLFEDLDSTLKHNEDKKKLRDITREVAQRQVFRLTLRNGSDSGPLKVTKGQEHAFINRPFKIKIDDIENDAVSVQLILDIDEQKVVPFWVTYFAMPLVDNTKMGEERISVTLLSSNGQEAELRLAVFPSDLAADRFDIKELSRELSQRTHDTANLK